MPQKAFNIRRNPKVSMLFSEPTASGIPHPVGVVLIVGDATAEDQIVTDMKSSRPRARPVPGADSRPTARGKDVEQLAGTPDLPGFVLHAHPDLRHTAPGTLLARPRFHPALPRN